MEAPNLYSNNADIKFPLDDTHEQDIPNHILTGLTISVPEGIVPALTGLRVGIDFVFAVFEDLNTGDAVADVRVDLPSPGIIYPMDMSVDGHAFIMFGPGAISEEGYFSGPVNVAVEAEAVTSLAVQGALWGLNVNSLDYSLSNVLELLSANDLIDITVEDNVVYIDRNDTVLDELGRADLLDRISGGSADPRIFTIADTLPDALGNIDIDIVDCIEDCVGANTVQISRGDLAAGTSVELPLDVFFPAKVNPNDPCSTGEEEIPVAEPTCSPIARATITNEESTPIGTIYAPSTGTNLGYLENIVLGTYTTGGNPEDVPLLDN
jgi:hypothetical protein